MKGEFPEIYKNKIGKLKTSVQNDYYYHASDSQKFYKNISLEEKKEMSKTELIEKINNIFKSSNYVYKADINIMYKNGKNINKKIIGFRNNYLMTLDGEKINIDDIKYIK